MTRVTAERICCYEFREFRHEPGLPTTLFTCAPLFSWRLFWLLSYMVSALSACRWDICVRRVLGDVAHRTELDKVTGFLQLHYKRILLRMDCCGIPGKWPWGCSPYKLHYNSAFLCISLQRIFWHDSLRLFEDLYFPIGFGNDIVGCIRVEKLIDGFRPEREHALQLVQGLHLPEL